MKKNYIGITHASGMECKRRLSDLFMGKLEIENILGRTLLTYDFDEDLVILVLGSK